MKFVSKIAVLVASMFMTLTAQGSGGSGGGAFGKTRLLLQSFAYQEAILTVDGLTNFPETETTPLLQADSDEFKDLLVELELAEESGKQFVLSVDVVGGGLRYFTFETVGEPGEVPFFIRATEVKVESGKDVE